VLDDIQDSRLVVKVHAQNQGVGAAIMTGHREAIRLKADISVIMAGDDQMDPEYLPDLLRCLMQDGYDYAKGNRFLVDGHLASMPWHRILGSLVLTTLTRAASGYWHISDPQNGYTAIRTKTLKRIDVSVGIDDIAKGYNFENDMLIHLGQIKARVADVPIPSKYNGSKSLIKIPSFALSTVLLIAKRSFQRLRCRSGRRGLGQAASDIEKLDPKIPDMGREGH
jgi:glycosyltransferase involved in cell wall biosynthesis